MNKKSASYRLNNDFFLEKLRKAQREYNLKKQKQIEELEYRQISMKEALKHEWWISKNRSNI